MLKVDWAEEEDTSTNSINPDTGAIKVRQLHVHLHLNLYLHLHLHLHMHVHLHLQLNLHMHMLHVYSVTGFKEIFNKVHETKALLGLHHVIY